MIYRIDVLTLPAARDADESAGDPTGESIRHQITELFADIGPIAARRLFLIESPAPLEQVRAAAISLLADPLVESAELVLEPPADKNRSRIEIHLKPGVTDPVAASTEMALRDLGLPVRQVRTGRAY